MSNASSYSVWSNNGTVECLYCNNTYGQDETKELQHHLLVEHGITTECCSTNTYQRPTTTKRHNKNRRERGRTERIRDGYKRLKLVLPFTKHASRSQILHRAIDRIKQLTEQLQTPVLSAPLQDVVNVLPSEPAMLGPSSSANQDNELFETLDFHQIDEQSFPSLFTNSPLKELSAEDVEYILDS